MLDLGNASPEQIAIVRIILKRIDITYKQLWEETQALPQKQRMSREAFDAALETLIEQKWLWKTGEGDSAVVSPRLTKRRSRLRLPVHMTQHGAPAFASLWQMLEAKSVAEGQSTTGAHSITPALEARLSDFFHEHVGARQIILLLIFLSAVNYFAMAAMDVTGVTGFVEKVGTQNLPWLNIAEMFLGLAVSAVYIQFADRIPRLQLMKTLLLVLIAVYLLLAGMFAFGLPALIIYPLIYLIRSQQVIIFPIAFWNLANSMYTMSDARQVFPLLASGEMIGGLIGYALFTEFFGHAALLSSQNGAIPLAIGSGLYLLNWFILKFALHEPTEEREEKEETSFIGNIRDGLEIIQSVPLFRYLALTVACVWLVFPLLDYHFYTNLNTYSNGQSSGFANFYSWYNIVMMLIPLLLQWQIIPALAKRVSTRSAFIALPAILVLATIGILIGPGMVILSAIVLLLSYVVYSSWDAPMMNALQSLVPEERRARVSTLLSNYSYAAGKIVGSFVLGIILLLNPQSGTQLYYIYLPLALLVAVGGVISAFRVRSTYETSMLSWRIARRPRIGGAMDKLDF